MSLRSLPSILPTELLRHLLFSLITAVKGQRLRAPVGWRVAISLLLPFCVQAQVLVLTPEIRHADLAPYLSILEDPSGQQTLEQVSQGALSGQFQPWKGAGDLNLGYTKSAWWLRVALQRGGQAPGRWLLEMPYLNLDHIDFYAPDRPPILTGSARPLESRPLRHRFFVLPVEPGESPSYFYVRITSAYALTVPISVWQPDDFVEASQQQSMMHGLYFGGLFALMFYNLLIAVSLRDLRFLFYALYVSLFGLGMLAGNGFGRVLLWPQAQSFDAVSQSFFLSLSAMLSILLTRAFLNTPKLSRLANLGLAFFASAFGLIAMGYLASVWLSFSAQALHTLMISAALPSAVLIMGTGFLAMRQRQVGARFFVLAWGLLWMGGLVASFRAIGWLPSTWLTSYSLQLSSALEMLLLALALADLIRLERNAKVQAQTQALRASESMLSASRAASEKLEQAVVQRTTELAHALAQERRLHEQQSRLGALISHEFRNPLGIIDSQISLLRKEQALGRMQLDKRIDTMAGAVRRLRSLFDTWLNSDRVRKSLETAELKPLRVAHWLKTLGEVHAPLIDRHPLTLQGLDQAFEVLGDADLLEIAVTNLIDNACKYSPEGARVVLALRVRPGAVGVAVIDEGAGIAPEHQRAVFKEYYRIHPEGSVPGMGLGLAFVARVAQMHNGHVELQSQLGRGSTFCLWLPTLDSHTTA